MKLKIIVKFRSINKTLLYLHKPVKKESISFKFQKMRKQVSINKAKMIIEYKKR